MGKFTLKHAAFLRKHGFENPDDWALDATGMTRNAYRAALSSERKIFAYGLEPCPRGHTLRTSGGCPQCVTSYIAYAMRSRLPGFVYIAKCGRMTKVGFSKEDAGNRIYIANLDGYAGKHNWQVRACLYSPIAGKIELALVRALRGYSTKPSWERNGTTSVPTEVFVCSYDIARQALLSVASPADAPILQEYSRVRWTAINRTFGA